MTTRILRRIGAAVLLALLAAATGAVLLEIAPGDAGDLLVPPGASPELEAAVRSTWHLDDPAPLRCLTGLGRLATGRFGTSLVQGRPVADLLGAALPWTLLLSGSALLLAYTLGIPLGVHLALRRRGARCLSAASLILLAMPSFWIGLVLVMVFAGHLGWLPASGSVHWAHDGFPPGARLADHLRHLVLPAVTLGLPGAATVARYLRTSLDDVLASDWLCAVRARGVPERRLLWRHAVPNALGPVLALAGLSLPALFSGSAVVETVFAWPGLGRVVVEAILGQDIPVVLAALFVYALLVVAGNALADLAAVLADPRLRHPGSAP